MDELVRRLRCQRFGNCPNCPMWYTEEVEPNLWGERCAAIDAADAIEELSKRVPKSPHGRLIDADAFVDELGQFCDDNWVYNTLRHAPTIIPSDPAEEGE